MSKKDKISLPASGAGLVRYFDEESTGPKVSPEQVVAITIVLAILCIILRFSSSG
ncbi:MAG: preprotein translocase subunit Sec61beta [Methanobrevibacter sp.]|jgi:preprotein translocase subunit Sec61beta|nr:preprotein translocase subunit Sec61beta [Candidatus Methanovirga basalitermitum]